VTTWGGRRFESGRYLRSCKSTVSHGLVSGDKDLLDLADRLPVLSPAGFLELLADD
jgi:hypothetical protein